MSTPAPTDVLITNTVQGQWLLQGGRIAARGQGGRIAARGAQLAVPTDATVIDGSGCLVLPGLVDAHAHIDPMGLDRDPKGQLDGLFAIAGRHGCALDIHLHDRGELGAVTLEMIADRSAALGLRGRVAISHAFCLGSVELARLEALIEQLLREDIAIMTQAPSGTTPFPPLKLLHQRGVRLFTGSDGVRDTWSPLNNGDMLERAYLLAYRNGLRQDEDIATALDLATHGGAQVMGAEGYGLDIGCQADLLLVEAQTTAEEVVMHPPRRAVFKRGRLVAGALRS